MRPTTALLAVSLSAVSSSVSADPLRALAVECAVHAGRRDAESIVWDSVFLTTTPEGCGRLTLARALPASTAVVGTEGEALTVHRDPRGRIVSVEVCAHQRVARLTLSQPAALGAAHFAPAFAAGMAVQALTLDGEEGLRFAPSSDAQIEVHRMWMASAGVDEMEVARCAQRMFWPRPSVLRPPIFARATAPTLDADGLAGELSSERLRRERTFRRISALALALVAVGLLLRKKLASAVEGELVDALIRSHRRDSVR